MNKNIAHMHKLKSCRDQLTNAKHARFNINDTINRYTWKENNFQQRHEIRREWWHPHKSNKDGKEYMY
jgi:hypothetical protein